MDNKATTKRMIGAVVLVLVAALLLAWLLKGKNRESQTLANQTSPETQTILGFPDVSTGQKPTLVDGTPNAAVQQAAAPTAAAGGGLLSGVDVKLPSLPSLPVKTVSDTTGFDVRPSGSEVRGVVDTNGQVAPGTGSLGTGDTKMADSAAAAATSTAPKAAVAAAAGNTPAPAPSKPVQEKPVAEHKPAPAQAEKQAEKKAFKPVLQGEHVVPKAESVESNKEKEAAAKSAAAKATAAKAAEDKAKKANDGKDAATAAGTGTYVIQVAALADKAKAEAMHKSLVADGHAALVKEVKVDGKTVYRVQIGPYPKKEDALSVQAKMKAKYPTNAGIQKSFVTTK